MEPVLSPTSRRQTALLNQACFSVGPCFSASLKQSMASAYFRLWKWQSPLLF